jgi:phosphopentomutase
MRRFVLIVLDSVGIGALPDASLYNDTGANTLGHIAELYPGLTIPNLVKMGLGNIDNDNLLPKSDHPVACFGKAAELSAGKDTTTGHWEIAGSILAQAFPTFPEGFPADFVQTLEDAIGKATIGNYAASGTEIINQLGDQHVQSGCPILYTSADSVLQIAMHEDIIPIERQYEICSIARHLLVDSLAVGRVIARPFLGSNGNYTRTKNRKDFSLLPPYTVLDAILQAGKKVKGIGKIYDIFAGKGISESIKTGDNAEGIDATIEAILNDHESALIFTNLVDFDMLYGHRRDVPGYARCLMHFDDRLPDILTALKEDDVLIITADHGNDPSFKGSDHTREYIPLLIYGKQLKQGYNLGIRQSYADIAASIAEGLGLQLNLAGVSFYKEILV